MKCKRCNSTNKSNDKYCKGCGTDQTVEQHSLGIKSLFSGSWKYYKNNRRKSYIVSLVLIFIIVYVAFFSESNDNFRIFLFGTILVLQNTLPFLIVRYRPELSIKRVSTFLNTFAALYMIYFCISFIQRTAIEMEIFEFLVSPVFNIIVVLICIPIFTFTIIIHFQNEISYFGALRRAVSLILDNPKQVLVILLVLTIASIAGLIVFVLPALLIMPFISYAWAFYHRSGADMLSTTDLST